MALLQEIYQHKETEVRQRQRAVPLGDLKKMLQDRPVMAKSRIGLEQALKQAHNMAVIAEVKAASPSQGVLHNNFQPVVIAKGYEQAGAGAISVLTDKKYFQGDLQFLKDVALQVSIPVLQKDFVLDAYQIYEAKWLGAKAILLIVRFLSQAQFIELHTVAQELGLDVLVEIHDEVDLQRLVDCPFVRILGINNRCLDDLSVDIQRSIALKQTLKSHLAQHTVLVSESGLETAADVALMRRSGFHAVLMGTSFMRHKNPAAALAALQRQNSA